MCNKEQQQTTIFCQHMEILWTVLIQVWCEVVLGIYIRVIYNTL